MNKQQNNVLDWMDTFGQECPAKPCIPDSNTRRLRARLILEEALETVEALGFATVLQSTSHALIASNKGISWGGHYYSFDDVYEPNLVAIADGIADLNYVSYGTAIACGLDMEPIEQEVHKNNMSKLWSSDEIAEEYSNEEIEELKLEKLPAGKYKGFYVVKNKHGKILKPPGHGKPNLEPLIKAQE